MSNYILENELEFQRLEKQSKNQSYDYEIELSSVKFKKNSKILDAGCGSGIVSRYLANRFPDAEIIGCDFSDIRIQQAKNEAKSYKNCSFQTENLKSLTFAGSSFDSIVCRYVLEHLDQNEISIALSEFYRCTKNGGNICIIDMDGLLHNLYPQTPFIKTVFQKFEQKKPIDLDVGRKLPLLLAQTGFKDVTWKIDTLQFNNENIDLEKQLIVERFQQARPFLCKFLDSEYDASRFVSEYIECLEQANTVLFYNKFIVQGYKS